MQNRLTICLFLFLSLLSEVTQAKKVVLKGHILSTSEKPYGDQYFVVERVTDYLTFKREVIGQGRSGANGDFSVQVELDYTSFIVLKFPKVERTLYAVPGKAYYIDIKAPIEVLEKQNGRYAKDVRMAYIVNHHPTELNYLIDTIDFVCSKFLHEEIEGRKSKAAIDQLFGDLYEKYKYVEEPYFQDYLKYKHAELLLFIYKKKRQAFATRFFETEENIALHIQKMQVFNSFFRGNMKYEILIDDKHPFHKAFRSGDLELCLQLVCDLSGQSRELRELVLLHGISEIRNAKYYKDNQINFLLDRIISETNFEHHRVLARNLRNLANHLKAGTPAPPMAVRGLEAFDIAKMRGKYIYLFFFQTWDATLQTELPYLKALQNQFGNDLHIVGVAVDPDKKQYLQFRDAGKFNWTCIHYNFQTEILDQWHIEDHRVDRYDIESTQQSYLIGPQGNLLQSPAKAPSKGFEDEFARLLGR